MKKLFDILRLKFGYLTLLLWSSLSVVFLTRQRGSSTSATIIVRIFLEDTHVLSEEPLRNFRRKPLDYLANDLKKTFFYTFPPQDFLLEVRNYLLSLACLLHYPILRCSYSNFYAFRNLNIHIYIYIYMSQINYNIKS